MDRCPGRLTVTKKTMRVGTEIYRELVKKMLSYHISIIERKTRACLRCPPRCPEVPRFTTRRPYTTPHKGEKWLPQRLLPSYLKQRILENPRQESQLRRSAENVEAGLEQNHGDPLRVEQARDARRAMLQARLNSMEGSEDEKRPEAEAVDESEELGGRSREVTPGPTGVGDPVTYTPRPVERRLGFDTETPITRLEVIKEEEVADADAAEVVAATALQHRIQQQGQEERLNEGELADFGAAVMAQARAQRNRPGCQSDQERIHEMGDFMAKIFGRT